MASRWIGRRPRRTAPTRSLGQSVPNGSAERSSGSSQGLRLVSEQLIAADSVSSISSCENEDCLVVRRSTISGKSRDRFVSPALSVDDCLKQSKHCRGPTRHVSWRSDRSSADYATGSLRCRGDRWRTQHGRRRDTMDAETRFASDQRDNDERAASMDAESTGKRAVFRKHRSQGRHAAERTAGAHCGTAGLADGQAALQNEGKILSCGNGGSAGDSLSTSPRSC